MQLKKTKIFKKFLTTVSVTSIITAAASSFGAAAPLEPWLNADNASLKNAVEKGNGFTTGAIPAGNSFVVNWYGDYNLNADLENAKIQALSLSGYNGKINVVNSLSVGSIVNHGGRTGAGAAVNLEVTLQPNQNLTLTGNEAPANAGSLTAGHRAINANDYTGLGNIAFGDNSAVTIHSYNDGNSIFDENVKAIKASKGTLNVKSNLEIKDNSFAGLKKINIDDGKKLHLNTNSALAFQQNIGDIINFGTEGEGILEITIKNSAHNITVANGSLGGNQDGHGEIIMNVVTHSEIGKVDNPNPLVGRNANSRAKKFVIKELPNKNNTTSINQSIFAQNIELNRGTHYFAKEVNVGGNGATALNAAEMVLSISSNLGKVDFKNSKEARITIRENQNLIGDFYGDQTNNTKKAGILSFRGNNELKGSTNNITEIRAAKDLKLSGIHKFDTLTFFNKTDHTLRLGNGTYEINNIKFEDNPKVTLEFINTDDVIFTTEKQDKAPVVIEELRISGGNVKLAEKGNKKNHAFGINNINFTNANSASTVTLLPGQLNNLNILSSAGNTFVHRVAVGGDANTPLIHTINRAIGSQDNIVNIHLTGEKDVLNIATPNFFASVTAKKGNKVSFTKDSQRVYGLGSSEEKLTNVLFGQDAKIENFGDIYADEVHMEENATLTSGRIVATNFILKSGTKLIFKDGSLLGNSTIMANKDSANQSILFQGDALVGNIHGTKHQHVAQVEFLGDKKLAKLKNNIIAGEIKFNTNNIEIIADPVILVGKNVLINGNINLNTNKLIFGEGQFTLGANTSVTTEFDGSKLGSIEFYDEITVKNEIQTLNFHINDEADINIEGEYLFIENLEPLETAEGGYPTLNPSMTESTQAYVVWQPGLGEDGNLYLKRSKIVAKKAEKEIQGLIVNPSNPTAKDKALSSNIEILTNPQNEGDAKQVLKEVGQIRDVSIQALPAAIQKEIAQHVARNNDDKLTDQQKVDSAVRAITIKKFTEVNDAEARDTLDQVVKAVLATSTIRIMTAFNFNKLESYTSVAAAAGDEHQIKYGAWATPFYNKTTQKMKKDINGYKATTSGGTVGFDIAPNENSIIGAAISVTKTYMKHEDTKVSDKTEIHSIFLSLYGAQYFSNEFFGQATASVGQARIENKEQRFGIDANQNFAIQIAKSKYKSLLYSGEVLFGYDIKPKNSLLITPLAGIRYNGSNEGAYKETGTTNQNRIFEKKSNNKIEGLAGLRGATLISLANNTALTPEVHFMIAHKIGGKTGNIKTKFPGQFKSLVIKEDNAPKTFYNAGLSISAKTNSFEYGAGYDTYIAKKYIAHQGTLKLRVNF